MSMLGVSSAAPRKTAILPEGGRDFLRRRMMELVGFGVTALGMLMLLALFTYSPADPSLNHATGGHVRNLLGGPGAVAADLVMQLFGFGAIAAILPLAAQGLRLDVGLAVGAANLADGNSLARLSGFFCLGHLDQAPAPASTLASLPSRR